MKNQPDQDRFQNSLSTPSLTDPYSMVVKNQVLAHYSMDAICWLQLELARIRHSFMVSEAANSNMFINITRIFFLPLHALVDVYLCM